MIYFYPGLPHVFSSQFLQVLKSCCQVCVATEQSICYPKSKIGLVHSNLTFVRMKHFLKKLCKDIFLCCDVSDVALLVLCNISLCTSCCRTSGEFCNCHPIYGNFTSGVRPTVYVHSTTDTWWYLQQGTLVTIRLK